MSEKEIAWSQSFIFPYILFSFSSLFSRHWTSFHAIIILSMFYNKKKNTFFLFYELFNIWKKKFFCQYNKSSKFFLHSPLELTVKYPQSNKKVSFFFFSIEKIYWKWTLQIIMQVLTWIILLCIFTCSAQMHASKGG